MLDGGAGCDVRIGGHRGEDPEVGAVDVDVLDDHCDGCAVRLNGGIRWIDVAWIVGLED